jgi:hypothetical protein
LLVSRRGGGDKEEEKFMNDLGWLYLNISITIDVP